LNPVPTSGVGYAAVTSSGCLLSEELDLLLAVSLLVVLGAFADVLLAVLQHAIDQSGEPVDTVRVKTGTVYSGRREAGVVMASTGPPVSEEALQSVLQCKAIVPFPCGSKARLFLPNP
jgi:hypothetical protein